MSWACSPSSNDNPALRRLGLLRSSSTRPTIRLDGQPRFLSSTSSIPKPISSHGSTISQDSQRRILQRCDELQSYLQPINDRLRGPLEKCSDKAPLLPFVFLLGNHSSGKSSFINFVCKRPIQTAGVAPTDDSFTIIAPGPSDIDQDGPSIVGDPDMGFAGLRHFGPDLIHHTQLKIRSGLATPDFMLVDSPGMIDSPHAAANYQSPSSHVTGGGYKGTTGETLSVLTQPLAGMDHKLYIVLNKADQFRRIQDFARAYGSLCWNLSKVIPRKDLPRIYTMCLPAAFQRQQEHQQPQGQDTYGGDKEASSLGLGLTDLEKSREEVVSEVLKAPKRRIDNVITRLADSVNLVQMHALVLEGLRSDFARELWTFRAGVAGLLMAGTGFVGGGLYLGLALQPMLAFGALYTVGTVGFVYTNNRVLGEHEALLASPEGLRRAFERLYARPVLEGDEFVTSLWKRTFPSLQMMVETQAGIGGGGLGGLPKVSTAELQEMQRILHEEIPSLRRLAAPVSWTFKNNSGSSTGGSSGSSGGGALGERKSGRNWADTALGSQ
ncbi:hypothetical protein VYU27_000335 [Nannochloropsis oceanica]